MTRPELHTPRLTLIGADRELARLQQMDLAAFFQALQTPLAPDWPPPLNDAETIAFGAAQLIEAPEAAGWWAWFVIDRESRSLLGQVAFIGPPDEEEATELTFSFLPSATGRGFAKEAVAALALHAFAQGAGVLIAHADHDDAAAARVLLACGFTTDGAQAEPGVDVWLRRKAR